MRGSQTRRDILHSMCVATPSVYSNVYNKISKEDQKEISAEIISMSAPSGDYSPGEELDVNVTIENTGEVSHTFSVGIGALGSDGQYYGDEESLWAKTISLEPGSRAVVSIQLSITNEFRNDEYDLRSTIWKESDIDGLQTALDTFLKTNVFSVSDSRELSTEESPEVIVVVETVTETVYVTKSPSRGQTASNQSKTTPWTIIQTITAVIGAGIAILEYRRRSKKPNE